MGTDTERIRQIEQLIENANQLKHTLGNDPHRPRYHFMPDAGWINDINGSIFWKGRYHIFYQQNPNGAYHHQIQWGHSSSADLIHWVHHPAAMTPTPGGPDRDGCYSGGAFVNRHGIPTFIYHGLPDGTCIATSNDDLLVNWTKHPENPVIACLPDDERLRGIFFRVSNPGDEPTDAPYIVRDPCAWLDGDTYYALVGNRIPGTDGDAASLFKSPDLVQWQHIGPFYQSQRQWTEAEEDCAVPNFFPLGDRYMLLYCTHLVGTQYYLGRLEHERFYPETFGRMSWYGGHLGGPQTLLDGQGRRIFFDWIREARASAGDRPRLQQRDREAGWSGVITLPRILSLTSNGTLGIEPAPEIEMLRMNHRSLPPTQIDANTQIDLDDIVGDAFELAIQFKNSGHARQFGLHVRCTPDGQEQTAVVFDAEEQKLCIDVSRSTLDPEIQYTHYRNHRLKTRTLGYVPDPQPVTVQKAPLDLASNEVLKLRVFLDRSVLEVFANGRQCISQRIYPTRPDSLGVRLFAVDGPVLAESIEAWDMAPTHD